MVSGPQVGWVVVITQCQRYFLTTPTKQFVVINMFLNALMS